MLFYSKERAKFPKGLQVQFQELPKSSFCHARVFYEFIAAVSVQVDLAVFLCLIWVLEFVRVDKEQGSSVVTRYCYQETKHNKAQRMTCTDAPYNKCINDCCMTSGAFWELLEVHICTMDWCIQQLKTDHGWSGLFKMMNRGRELLYF